MRLFVGVEFPATVLKTLVQCQNIVRGHSYKGRFKQAENFHITLKFLGEVPAGDIPQIAGALENIARGLAPLSLSLGKLGQFGGQSPIRVVWLDVAGDVAMLNNLQAQVEQALADHGFSPEARRWRPHITLAQDVTLLDGAPSWNGIAIPSASFQVTEFALILSQQQDRRRVYTPIRRFTLGQQL